MSSAIERLKALVAAKQLAAKAAADGIKLNVPPPGYVPPATPAPVAKTIHEITYNDRQQKFIDLVTSGSCAALIGPAGTGKTTCTKGAILSLIQSGRVPLLSIQGHKHLVNGVPGIVCVSFTNKAVENMRKVMPADLRRNCMTIHKLLEYAPEFYDVWDEKEGKYRKTMRFEPSWHDSRKLPHSLQTIIIDEASMVPVELWNRLFAALAMNPALQIILIGDIQQLPPVFGKSIFIHALQNLIPRVELTEVYRQALESPIISLAHTILRGEIIPAPKLESWNIDKLATGHGKVTIRPWKKALSGDACMAAMEKFLPEMIDKGEYTPMQDVILSPYNKAFGTIEMNKIIATHLARNYNSEGELVHEVVAGINKRYFRVGDKVLFNKTEHIITKIQRNTKYFGKPFKDASLTLDYWGIEHDAKKTSALAGLITGEHVSDEHIKNIDDILTSLGSLDETDKSELTRAASHTITVFSEELDSEEILESAGEVGQLDLAYAITVHKSQGSEYRRVFFITHQSQAAMLFRELIYTAVTRAKEELYIVCPPSLFVAGITSQRLPGKTLEDKIAAFERYAQLNKGKTSDTEIPRGMYLFEEKAA